MHAAAAHLRTWKMQSLVSVSWKAAGLRLASTVPGSILDTTASIDSSAYTRAKPFSSIPGPRGWPVVGNLLDYRFGAHPLERCHQIIADRYLRYGPLVRETILGESFLRVFDPDDANTILGNDGKTPAIRPLQGSVMMYRTMRNFSLGLGGLYLYSVGDVASRRNHRHSRGQYPIILLKNGEEWYRLRGAIQQAMMRPQAVLPYLPFMEEVAADFVDYIRQRRLPDTLEMSDFKQAASKWSLESSGMLVFEERLGSLSGGATEEWADKLIDTNTEMFRLAGLLKYSLPLYRWIATPKWRKLVAVEDYINGESRRLVEETVQKVLQSKGQTDGRKFRYMAYLLSRQELTKEDIFTLCLSLFTDGLNATAPTLIFTLYNLAANPECQEKAYKEVSENVPKNGLIDSSVLNKLTYLKACVKETLRLFPNNMEVSRVTQKDLVLSGYQVPSGTPCDINVAMVLTTDAYYKNPKSFIPEGWLREGKENGSDDAHAFLNIPFGHGPRMCAGRRFAEQDLYVMLSRLIQNFKIGYRYGEIGQHFKTLLVPDCNAQFTFEDRV